MTFQGWQMLYQIPSGSTMDTVTPHRHVGRRTIAAGRHAQRAWTACRAVGSENYSGNGGRHGGAAVGLALLALGLVACESEHAHYFERHVNHVSQDAVVQRWGPPHRAHELRTGEMVWSYEFRDRSNCAADILRFDRANILRDWNERKC
jgi:hypothetical protein